MTNANVTVNTVIENTVNNQRKQNKHLGIKEDLHVNLPSGISK